MGMLKTIMQNWISLEISLIPMEEPRRGNGTSLFLIFCCNGKNWKKLISDRVEENHAALSH